MEGYARQISIVPDLPSSLLRMGKGWRFDDVYSVLAALEVIEILNDEGISTLHPLGS